jgi:branched-subunit amino acid ABC-type transport system permease component
MKLLLLSLLDSWIYGSLLAAVAIALTLVFGLGRVVNFAIGSFYALGAFTVYSLALHVNYWLALIVAAAAVGALAMVVEVVTIRPLRSRPEISTLLVTFGVAVIVSGAIQAIWGSTVRNVTVPIDGAVTVLGTDFETFRLVAAALACCICALAWLWMRRSDVGLRLRAASERVDMASVLGVNTRSMFTIVFAASAFLAALVGGLAAPIFAVRNEMDVDFLIDAFLAVVIGGLGSFRGAIVGAYIVAAVSDVTVIYVNAQTATALTFTILAAVVLVRPLGIFGEGRALA